MKKLLIILFLSIIYSTSFSQGGWIRPNNAYGSLMNRLSIDSAFLFPTGCGIPASLKAYDLHRWALYGDSCNNLLYLYNPKSKTWSHISANSIDTTSLSNRINQKLNIFDSIAMLLPYLQKNIASATYQPIGSYLTSETDPVWISDSANYYKKLQTDSARNKTRDSLFSVLTSAINLKTNISDTASMLTPYAKTSLVNTKVNISDTSNMLTPYLHKSDTSAMLINYAKISDLNLKVNISDTASMLSNYAKTSAAAPAGNTGDIQIDSAGVFKTPSLDSLQNIGGILKIKGKLTVGGATSDSTLTDNGSLDVKGNSLVGGNINISGNVDIGGTAPTHTITLDSAKAQSGITLYNSIDKTTNYERGRMYWTSNTFTIANESGGTGVTRPIAIGTYRINLNNGYGSSGTGSFVNQSATSTATSGSINGISIAMTYNQTSGTAANTDLLINRTETSVGSGTQRLIDAQVGGASKFYLTNGGSASISARLSIGNASDPAASLHLNYSAYNTGSTFSTSGFGIREDAATYTSTSSSGTIGTAGVNTFAQPTFAANSATTLTNAATLYIANSPTNGTNVTITNPYALYVANGQSVFGGNVITGPALGSNANAFLTGSTLNVTASSNGPVLFAGASSVTFRNAFTGNISATLSAGVPYVNTIIGSSIITTASSGTHALLANFVVNPLGTVTSGGATVTETSSLYVNGAGSGGTTNLALHVAGSSANSSIDGKVGIGTTSPDSTLTDNGSLHVTGNTKLDGNFTLATAGSSFNITEGSNGRVGQTTLVSGTKAITISGLTTNSRAFVQLVTPSGVTLTTSYQAVCTTNTLTIRANVAAGTINTSDISVLNYFIIN